MLDISAKTELAGRIAAPLANIERVSVVDTGHGQGAARLASYVTDLMATSSDMLETVAGIDLNLLARRLTGHQSIPLTQAPPEVGDGSKDTVPPPGVQLA